MSTRAEMMAALAAIFDRPKSSVDAVDRVLTDAGLRTRAARGRAAQAMSAEDFANVTMGLMGGWSLRETPPMVERLGALHRRDGEMVEFDLEEDGEMMGIQGSADLTTHQILETNLPILYPRNKLPMARSLTGSLASLFERIPAPPPARACPPPPRLSPPPPPPPPLPSRPPPPPPRGGGGGGAPAPGPRGS